MKSLFCLLLLCVLLVINPPSLEAQVGGSGTPGQVPLWTESTKLGDSAITQITQSPDNKIGIGTTNPVEMLHIAGGNGRLRLQSSALDAYTIVEYAGDQREWHTGVAGSQVPNDLKNKYYIYDANAQQFRMVIDTLGRVGIGTLNPAARLEVQGGTGIGVMGISTNQPGVYAESSTGSGVFAFSNTGVGLYGKSNTDYAVYADGHLGVGRTVGHFGPQLCLPWGTTTGQIGTCSSSLRYKTDVRPFLRGLDIVNRLRPIAFTWKQGGMRGIGLAAEEVEKVEPLRTFRNDKQEVEGVNYNELSAVFVNAFVEQQTQIQKQQEQITQQQGQINQQNGQIEALKNLVCLSHTNAEQCK